MTSGPLGYGNHGSYDGSNGEELDRADRRHANWDQAPGLAVELTREPSVLWTAPYPLPLTLAAEPYTRLTLVDTEFNETQRDWWYLTQTVGGRAVMALRGLPWLSAYAGLGGGGGHVARELVGLWEVEYGVQLGPLRGSRARQFLEGGRRVEQLYLTYAFPLGTAARAAAPSGDWSVSAFTRLTGHPGRRVKPIHQNGAALTRRLGAREDLRGGLVELEVSTGAVESETKKPLREGVEHNYRTQDEVFWALYLGESRRLTALPGASLEFRAGFEVFYEDDHRVHGGEDTGWFTGVKVKLGLWQQENTAVSYGLNLVGGLDTFGFDYGLEVAIANWL